MAVNDTKAKIKTMAMMDKMMVLNAQKKAEETRRRVREKITKGKYGSVPREINTFI